MTQAIWSWLAANVPCMCGNATTAMVQSIEYRKLASPTEAVIRAGCFDALTMSAAIAGEGGSRHEEARQPAFVDEFLHGARQPARPAGIHDHVDRHAGAQLLRLARRLFDPDAHPHALHDLYPVARRVLRRHHPELPARSR